MADDPISEQIDEQESITFALPDWIQDLRVLTGASITIGGATVALTDDPITFVQAVIIDWLLSGIVSLIEQLIGLLLEAGGIVIDSLISAGSVLLTPFGIGGSTLVDLLILLDGTITSIASLGGPAAPIITVVVYAALVYLLALGVRTLLEVIKWLT